MSQQNAYQVSEWNGRSGERWVAHQSRLDAMLAVFGEAAIRTARVRAGEQVLDIGCGAGTSSRELAALVGAGGRVLGLDISAPLVERARLLAPPGARLAFELADAATADLPVAAFDLLFSRFGVMFFDDPAAAFARLRRALRPGGRLVFVCWREAAGNDWVRLPMGAIAGLVPPPAPPGPEAPGPFSFGDGARVTRILKEAGFADIELAAFDSAIPFGEGDSREQAIEDALYMASEVGPLSRVLADQPEDIRTRAAQAVRAAFAARPGTRSVMIDGAAWVVSANNPVA